MILGKAFGDYRILARLIYGESRCVYKALHSPQRQIYALALLQAPPALENPLQRIFLEQLELASRVNHAGIGRVYPLETCGEMWGVPLEFAHGQTLSEKVRGGQSSLDFTLRIAIQAAEGLAWAHSIGLFHGRLTPECLVVSPEGELKILDFAMTFLPKELALSESETDIPFASQTPLKPGPPPMAYLPPGQTEGLPADAASDLYSLGRILYELLWGQFLVQSDDPRLIQQQILEHDLPDLSEVRHEASTHWSRVLRKLTSKKPPERYPSAQALLEDLKRLRDGWPTPHLSFTQKNRPMSRRSFFLRFLGDEGK